jgi:hypothetical protein
MMSSGLNKSFDVINPVANVGNILLWLYKIIYNLK